MYWANVAVVFKITILLLVTYLVSLKLPSNFRNNWPNFIKFSGHL